MIDGKRIYFLLTILSYLTAILMGIIYIYTNSIQVLLFTVLLVLFSSILYTFNNLRYYIIHLLFYITIFIFLVSRPTIDYFKNGVLNTYQVDAYRFAFISVIISLVGLTIGGFLVSKKEWVINNYNKNEERKNWVSYIRKTSLSVFIVSYPFYLIRLIERLIYRMNFSYYEYYANFKSELPYFTYILSTFVVYAMCIYLATKPKKFYSALVLGAFVFANVINLLVGTRNPFVLSVIFAFLYYFIRNQEEKDKWIGLKEKLVLYIGAPLMMVAMGLLNYVRDDAEINKTGVFDILLDFIYKQGTSFGVLTRGYLYESNLPIKEFRNYTFSPIIEYFSKGNLAILFGGRPFTATNNSMELALQSDRYPHNISYIVMKEEYLEGHGIGSSYIMEIYTDYGLAGVFLFSILLGILFILMMRIAYSGKILLFGMTLLVLNNLFFMPRSSFSESFFSLFTLQFWGIIIVIFVSAGLLKNNIKYVVNDTGGQ